MKRILIFILFVIIFKSGNCQVLGNMIEDAIQSTVLIKIGGGSGSGILVKDSTQTVFLITAKHVLFDSETNYSKLNSDSATIQFYARDFKSNMANYIILDLIKLQSEKLLKVDSTHDICVVKIAYANELNKLFYYDGITRYGYATLYSPYYFNKISIVSKKDLLLGEEIFIVGFPTSIGLTKSPQFDYERPLLKRGSVASISDRFDNYVIDCPVYGGNSGGPVFLERKDYDSYHLRLIGLVIEFIPFVNETLSKQDLTVQNSSYAVIVPIEYGLKLLYED